LARQRPAAAVFIQEYPALAPDDFNVLRVDQFILQDPDRPVIVRFMDGRNASQLRSKRRTAPPQYASRNHEYDKDKSGFEIHG
jgi:hypothetical protein